MPVCPSCTKEVSQESSPCPSCGAPLEELSPTATKAQPSPASLGIGERTAFTPGDTLAGRYRIVLQVGKGGMGDVYRAHDLELSQAVALKFLPADLQSDSTRLERFRREVRIARQVAHPNVCRVYDIGQADGLHFLSMEYIDGEDLGSLLRRIRRLPGDKAVEMARELCAGLAAAHEKGVLHRDLKPANVMIDGRGKVRLASPRRWDPIADGELSLIRFWYRQSPTYLVPHRLTSVFSSELDPPPLGPGMVGLRLDPQGRLRAFNATAPQLAYPPAQPPDTDWSVMFAEAGLDLGEFEPVESQWHPTAYADELAAWEGVYPDSPQTPIRIEAVTPLALRRVSVAFDQPEDLQTLTRAAPASRRHAT